MKKGILAILFAGSLMFTGCGSSSSSSTGTPTDKPPVEKPTVEEPAVGQTTIVTVDGETINVKETENGFIFQGYEGKVVLLEFYGDTCPHCIDSIPRYNNIQAKYNGQVVVISVETYGQLNSAQLKAFAQANNMQYKTVATEMSGNLRQHGESIVGKFGGVPYLFVLDKTGAVSTSVLADLTQAEIEGLFINLL